MPEPSELDPYDRVPYPDLIHPQTHPDRLAVMGTLFGMKPAPVERCRVLEIGCGPGLNVIAMAEGLPASRFVGVDASSRHVARAGAIIDALGLRNVEVLQQDLVTFDPGSTRYDYVVAHGVYSWIDESRRGALLRLVGTCLDDHGIAFVSYNTYPGWFMLRAIREMMLFHGRGESDPVRRVARASEILQFLLEHLDAQSSPYGASLVGYKRAMEDRRSLAEPERVASILHDELSAVNEPVFFHQFAAQASDAGLQYIAEVDLRGSTPAHIPAALVQRLKALASDLISLEQYMDFLMNRSFRQTLLCRRQVHLNRTLTASENVLRPFYLSTGTVPVEGVHALQKEGALRMTAPDGQELVTAHPLSIAALQVLAPESAAALAWTELIARATAIVEGDGGTVTQEDRDTLAGNVLRAFTAVRSFIGLSTLPDRYVPEISERPMAVALVRLLAREGCRRVPNRRHERVMLGPLAMALVTHLDGTHSLDDLLAIDERARLDRGPGGGEDDADEATFEARLAFLARSALLEA